MVKRRERKGRLLTFLKEEISRRERAESFKLNKFPDAGKREERKPKPNVNRRPATAAALHSTTEMECVFCGKRNHGSPQCWTAKKLPLNDRKQAVLKANLCFRCLTSTHLAKDCKAQCDKCNRGHHKTLCPSTGRDVKIENRAEKPQVNLVAEKEDSGREIDLIALSGQIHKINAIEVPVICNPIARPEIPQDILNLVPGVQFAEFQEGHFKVDMLIGLDNFWTLMRNNILRFPEHNLLAQETVLGFVLSGQVPGNNKQCISAQQLLVLNDFSEHEIRNLWKLYRYHATRAPIRK